MQSPATPLARTAIFKIIKTFSQKMVDKLKIVNQ